MLSSLEGNQEAYGTLLHLVNGLVKKYLRKSLDAQMAEDLTQEVLLSIHRKMHTFQIDQAFLPWMYAISRYRLIDYIRSEKRKGLSFEFDEKILSDHEEEEEVGESFTEIIQDLTDKQREMLTLVKVEGLSSAEAAKKLNISLSALKVGVHRAIKELKRKRGEL